MIPGCYGEIEASGLFDRIELFRYDWDQMYGTANYVDLVRSYSDTAQMAPDRREEFLAELADFIDADFGGYVVRPLVITVAFARKPQDAESAVGSIQRDLR